MKKWEDWDMSWQAYAVARSEDGVRVCQIVKELIILGGLPADDPYRYNRVWTEIRKGDRS